MSEKKQHRYSNTKAEDFKSTAPGELLIHAKTIEDDDDFNVAVEISNMSEAQVVDIMSLVLKRFKEQLPEVYSTIVATMVTGSLLERFGGKSDE